jgi:c-di-GMP-binding flagellar brake protein YcgR
MMKRSSNLIDYDQVYLKPDEEDNSAPIITAESLLVTAPEQQIITSPEVVVVEEADEEEVTQYMSNAFYSVTEAQASTSLNNAQEP